MATFCPRSPGIPRAPRRQRRYPPLLRGCADGPRASPKGAGGAPRPEGAGRPRRLSARSGRGLRARPPWRRCTGPAAGTPLSPPGTWPRTRRPVDPRHLADLAPDQDDRQPDRPWAVGQESIFVGTEQAVGVGVLTCHQPFDLFVADERRAEARRGRGHVEVLPILVDAQRLNGSAVAAGGGGRDVPDLNADAPGVPRERRIAAGSSARVGGGTPPGCQPSTIGCARSWPRTRGTRPNRRRVTRPSSASAKPRNGAPRRPAPRAVSTPVARSGRSSSPIAPATAATARSGKWRDFDLTETVVRESVKQADIDAGRRLGLTTVEREELSKLRRENRQLPGGRASK